MERQIIKSKLLRSVGYDATKQDLAVEFLRRESEEKRRVYVYHAVPAEKYSEMMGSESIGSFFLTMIKPNYKFTLQEEVRAENKTQPAAPAE